MGRLPTDNPRLAPAPPGAGTRPARERDRPGHRVKPIGPRLTRARSLAGLNKSELARRVGVSRPTLVGWEADPDGAANPGWQHVVAIADACEVDPSWLLTGRGRPRQVQAATDSPADEQRVALLDKLARLPPDLRELIEQEVDVLNAELADGKTTGA